MIAENLELEQSELIALRQNSEKKKVILKIIIQALYSLGLQKSASELQKQSQITYLSPQVKTMREKLIKQNYGEVQKELKDKNIQNLQICQILHQLQYLKCIREDRVEEALQLLQNSNFQQNKVNKLAEELLIGGGHVPEKELLKKYELIVEKCLKKDIEENSLQKILKQYIKLEKRGLTKILPGLSVLEDESQEETLPPKNKIITKNMKEEISFLKFNRKGSQFVTICEGQKKKLFYICQITKNQIEIVSEKQLTIEEDIENISWDYDSKVFAISTYYRIITVSDELEVLQERSLRSQGSKSLRILCCEWNPVNKFLYVSGSFESVKTLNTNLEEVMVLQPFMSTRNFCFNEQGTLMFAISATSGLLIVYNIFSEKEECRIKVKDLLMSLRVKGKNILVTSQKCVYYYTLEKVNKSYQIFERNKFNSPENSGSIVLEAVLFKKWVICLGQKKFKANLLDDKKFKQVTWQNEQSSAFDSSENYLVSGSRKLMVWDNEKAIESEYEMDYESDDDDYIEDSSMISEEIAPDEQDNESEQEEEYDMDDD